MYYKAPVSLAGALQEYLNDPNFEQNRIEYKTNKESADKNGRSRSGASSAPKGHYISLLHENYI